jgi:hypothetical protein
VTRPSIRPDGTGAPAAVHASSRIPIVDLTDSIARNDIPDHRIALTAGHPGTYSPEMENATVLIFGKDT